MRWRGRPGDEHTSNYSAPALWALLDRLYRECWPRLLRGDAGFGVEPIMAEAGARGLAYLFKLRLTKNVRRMIEKLARTADWIDAGAGFEANCWVGANNDARSYCAVASRARWLSPRATRALRGPIRVVALSSLIP